MKPVTFLGDSRRVLKAFPDKARYRMGVELRAVQKGLEPGDWKPLKTAGAGVREIRVRDVHGSFRVIYVANLEDRVLVLHAFQKKTRQTAQKDIDVAADRLQRWMTRK